MLNAILNVDKPDIVFIVETFRTPDIPSNEVLPGYQVLRKDVAIVLSNVFATLYLFNITFDLHLTYIII